MSGKTRDSYRGDDSFASSAEIVSKDPAIRKKSLTERGERIKSARAFAPEVPPDRVRETRKTSEFYNPDLVKLKITRPAPKVKKVYVVLVDNSGSNRVIAQHLRDSSGYLTASMGLIAPEAQIAWVYFSDHCDGPNLMQEVDFVFPDDAGDKTLLSSFSHINPASGGDAPEAIECTMMRACEIDFGKATEKHLILVSDVVAHGMGMREDGGCPDQVSWKDALAKVRKTFTTFEMVGCSPHQEIGDLQRKFFSEKRVDFDLIDLSNIREAEHRMAITGNALLFLIARHHGLQAVTMFLGILYEKWLKDPIFGKDTDTRARAMIERFCKFLEAEPEKVAELLQTVIPD
jgi:hypothetical protein